MVQLPRRSGNRSGSLILACDFAARQPGSFVASQVAVADAVKQRLQLDTVFVLPERARRRHWVEMIPQAGHALAFIPAHAWQRPPRLLEIARASNARIIHSHYVWFDLDALYAGRRAGAATIWHVRNGLLDYPIAQRLRDLLKARLLARGCAAVVAVSESVAADLRRRGFPPQTIRVVRNALVLERFTDVPDRRVDARARAGVAESTFLIVSLCWPPARKGADVLTDAALRLGRRLAERRVELVLIGERDGIEAFLGARFGDLPEWIRISAPVPEIGDVLAAADVFVSAAREEGFSFAIGEAMASAVPVVGSDIRGTSHYWDAPGFVKYGVEDAEALADRLYDLATTDAPRRLGELNREWAFAELGIDRYVAELVELYSRCLER